MGLAMLFDDLRVIEFGHYIAGPLAAMLLGEQGADVVKVERPDGDPMRASPAFETWNRGKRIVRLDLKTTEGLDRARELVAEADVVIDGLRPGVLEGVGLGARRLTEQRADLIACTFPGFAEQMGLENVPAWEPMIAATGGLYRPSLLAPSGDEAVFTPLPFASTYAGLLGAASIAAAAVARGRWGRGQVIEVPVHSALFLAIGFALQRVDGEEDQLFSGGVNPLLTTYQCADERWIYLHAGTPRFIAGLIECLGIQSWVAEGLFDPQRLLADPTLAETLHERLRERFHQRTAVEWETELSDAGLCCACCRTVEEWLAHPHATEAGLVVTVDSPFGATKQPGRMVGTRETAGAPLSPATVVEAAESPWRSARPAREPATRSGARSRPVLDGVRVLDLCLILAGPTCARVLGELGADVIKIDPPSPVVIESFWRDTNRAKRSIVLDIKTDAGREVMWKLIEAADVVIENFRLGVAERLGIGYEQVAARYPEKIYASMNCYGYDGPFAGRPGWEQLAQAVSGMQVRYGGREGQPMLAPYAVNDYASGISAAIGVLGALHERERTGRGQRVTSALASTAGLLQALYMVDYPGYERHDIEGPDAKGYSALSRMYRAADRPIYVHCPSERWPALADLPGFGDLAGTPIDGEPSADSALAEAIAENIAARPATYWLGALTERGIGAASLESLDTMRADPRLRAAGLLTSSVDAHGRTIEHVGIPHRLSATPARSGSAAPDLGADTVEILTELGYHDDAIGAMFASGAIAT